MPSPIVFCKCAERYERKGDATFSGSSVCAKCPEEYQKKGLIRAEAVFAARSSLRRKRDPYFKERKAAGKPLPTTNGSITYLSRWLHSKQKKKSKTRAQNKKSQNPHPYKSKGAAPRSTSVPRFEFVDGVRVSVPPARRDRVVPIGERALFWLEQYLAVTRPKIVKQPDDCVVFLSAAGKTLTPNHLSWLARKYVSAAGIGKTGACHVFRHTMATLMLEGGADIRYIQAMLGHVRLDTTKIYTHVSIRMLKQIHAATHPAARL